MTRRVLIVSHVFPPLVAGGAPRMSQFAKRLPDHGWEVTVLTGKHADAVSLDNSTLASLGERVNIVRAWSPTSVVATRGRAVPRRGINAVIRRGLRTVVRSLMFPDREIVWMPAALAAGARALRKEPHDAVLATYTPGTNLLIGAQLARAFRLPLIIDFRDLWSTLPVEEAFVSPVHRAAARRIEGLIARKASLVTAVSPKMALSLAEAHGIPASRTLSITNAFDPNDAARAVDGRPSGARPFRLVYTGSVHADYDLDPFWQSVRELVDRRSLNPGDLRLEFVGNLALDDVRNHGLEDYVETGPFVPHDRVFEAFARADALLVVETPGYYADMSYAAKVFDYLLTGKPVMAVVDAGGNTDRLLKAAGVGYCAEARDRSGLVAQLEAILATKGQPPRRVDPEVPPLRDFNRRHLVAKLASALDDVVTREPHGQW